MKKKIRCYEARFKRSIDLIMRKYIALSWLTKFTYGLYFKRYVFYDNKDDSFVLGLYSNSRFFKNELLIDKCFSNYFTGYIPYTSNNPLNSYYRTIKYFYFLKRMSPLKFYPVNYLIDEENLSEKDDDIQLFSINEFDTNCVFPIFNWKSTTCLGYISDDSYKLGREITKKDRILLFNLFKFHKEGNKEIVTISKEREI